MGDTRAAQLAYIATKAHNPKKKIANQFGPTDPRLQTIPNKIAMCAQSNLLGSLVIALICVGLSNANIVNLEIEFYSDIDGRVSQLLFEPIVSTRVKASIEFTIETSITSTANSAILITLSGSPTIGSSPACTVTAPANFATCTPSMLSAQVLKILLVANGGGSFAGGTKIDLIFAQFTLPAAAQPSRFNVQAGTTSDGTAILDLSLTGTFPNITMSSMTGPAVTLGSQIEATTTTATVSFTPATVITAGVHAGISISLSGSGIALGAGSSCSVTGPSSGSPTCVASIQKLVLTVKLTAGTYYASAPVTFTLTSFMTPSLAQDELVNVVAVTSNDFSAASVIVNDVSGAGTFPAIFRANVKSGSCDILQVSHVLTAVLLFLLVH